MKRWTIIVITLVAVAAIGSAGYYGYRSSQPPAVVASQAPPTTPVTTCNVQQTVDAPGSLINTDETKIEMPLNGRLAEILVKPGDTIKAGQVLARVADVQQLQAAVAADQLALLQAKQDRAALDQSAPVQAAQAQVALQEAQAKLQQAQDTRSSLNYPRSDAMTINKLQAELALAQSVVAQAQENYDSLSALDANDPQRASAQVMLVNAKQDYHNAQVNLDYYKGSPSPADIAAADAKLALAQATLAQAQAEYAKVKAGPDALGVALADAKVANAQATLDTDQQSLASVEIKAPIDGVVLELTATVGETISKGAAVFTVNDPKAVAVKSTVTENDFPYVNLGQPASLYFTALPNETVTGTVVRIVPVSTGGANPLYEIYLSLDHVPAKLVEGMSADASISIVQHTNVLCLPRAVVQASDNGSVVVDVWANNQKEQRVIKVGLRGDTTVEILTGLKEGELVVTQ